MLFEIFLNPQITAELVSHAQATLCQSDTVLFKIKNKSVAYISWTDSDHFSCGEIRICCQPVMKCSGFSAKILLDSFIHALRIAVRIKRKLRIHANVQKELYVDDLKIASAEHRNRQFYVLSSDRILQRELAASVCIHGGVLDGFIANAASMAGSMYNGIGEFKIDKKDDQHFILTLNNTSDAGATCSQTIQMTSTTDLVRIIKTPNTNFSVSVSLGIFNRLRPFMTLHRQSDVNLIFFDCGLLLQTGLVDNIRSLIMISHISDLTQFKDFFA